MEKANCPNDASHMARLLLQCLVTKLGLLV